MDSILLFERSIEAAIQETKSLLFNSSCHYQKALEISESLMSYNVQGKPAQMQVGLKKMKARCIETVTMLINVLDEKDEYTRAHCQRVTKLALSIGHALQLSREDMLNLEFAGLLHDIGKIAIPFEIINKEERLTQQEYDIIKLHPAIGYQLVKDISFLGESRGILLQHHERVDGNGYPLGLVGSQIDFRAKILAVADAYDAMTNSRPYRKAGMTSEDAICELKRYKGSQFDEKIVDILVGLVKSGAVA